MSKLCVIPDRMSNDAIEDLDQITSRSADLIHVLSIGAVDCGSVVHDALLDLPHSRFTIATELQELWLVPKQEPVHLVILHHTLSEPELDDARWLVHEWWPHAIIMVIRSEAGLLHVALYDENAARSEVAEVLLGAIERLSEIWQAWQSGDGCKP